MEDEYMDAQDSNVNDVSNRGGGGNDGLGDNSKDFGDLGGYDDNYDDDDGGNNFRSGRGRGNFRGRGRGPPPGWMNGPPMRFRGRGYGPGGPPMRGRGFFRGRGGPRGFGPNNGPNFDNNWGPMGPPPPGMMGGPPPGMMGGPPPFGPPPGMMPPGGPMGPPPNMMGQPPPFGGPPGMPPPNMPAPELWVETKSEEGKSYYYHARTRETTWTRPQEGPACKVITQADIEAMAASGQMPSMGPNMSAGGGPVGPGGPGMGPMMGPGPGMMPPGVTPPFLNQPPPWLKDGSYMPHNDGKDSQQEEGSASDNDDVPPGEPHNGGMGGYPGVPGMGPGAANMGGPPGMGPGPFPGGFSSGWGGGWNGWPPPLVAQPPPRAGAAVPDAGAAAASEPPAPMDSSVSSSEPAAPADPPHVELTVIPPELAALAAEWSTHRAPDGRPYYYNAGKQESVWEKPQPMRELEELQAKVAAERGEPIDKRGDKEIDESKEVIDVDAHAEAVAAAEAERQAAEERERQAAAERERQAAAERERQAAERERERERLDSEKQEKEKQDKEKAKQDRSRPISSTPILGTPWCVVWTGDGSVFFYNSAAHSSVWERPAVLMGRADVDKAVSQPPAALLQLQRKDAAAAAAAAGGGAAAGAGAGTGAGAGAGAANGELKRAADSSTDPPADPKKSKSDDTPRTGSLAGGQIDAGAAAAIEAEVRAARERGALPHEQRLRAFLQMLHEKDVSAFSTWEKELHKIVFDPRYLMLNSKERRQVFDQYVRERAEEERKEKKNRLQQKKLAFRQLLHDAQLHSKSSFSEFSSKHGRDERFKGIEKARDRETYFNEHLADLRKREKEEKEKAREQARAELIALLRERGVDRHARWPDVKKRLEAEPRYKAVDGSAAREDAFKEYCRLVKEEKKKEKDTKDKDKKRERTSSKKEKRDKERDKDKEKEKEKDKDGKKDKKKGDDSVVEVEEEEEPEAEEVANGGDAEAAAREKEARAQASIKEREREVQRALATSLRDRDKEREYHKRDEAVQHFTALLADLVRDPELAWRDAKKQLKKDHRYSLAELLSKDDKERLFMQHTSALASKRRDKLRSVLAELNVSATAHWRDVRAQLADQPTAPNYSSSAQMEREFREFQRERAGAARAALRQLLAETRALTHRSRAAVRDNPAALAALLDAVRADPRYTALEHASEERQSLVLAYLEELEKRGPPPPPTATEPSRRAKQ